MFLDRKRFQEAFLQLEAWKEWDFQFLFYLDKCRCFGNVLKTYGVIIDFIANDQLLEML